MTWTLEQPFSFEASHVLPHNEGKRASLHGHSYIGRVVVTGDRLIAVGPERGMVVDYIALRASVENVVALLDHGHLNNVLDNPTSERVAQWLYERLAPDIAGLEAVMIGVTCGAACVYRAT